MKIEILYHTHYFERDLFLLNIDNHYTMVYRGSGLNGGRKGKVLPYTWLKDSPSRFGEIRDGIVPGYIFKEFFYKGYYKSHKKNLENISNDIYDFSLKLEEILENYETSNSKRYETKEDFDNILKIAKNINEDMKKIIKKYKLHLLDWETLIHETNIDLVLN